MRGAVNPGSGNNRERMDYYSGNKGQALNDAKVTARVIGLAKYQPKGVDYKVYRTDVPHKSSNGQTTYFVAIQDHSKGHPPSRISTYSNQPWSKGHLHVRPYDPETGTMDDNGHFTHIMKGDNVPFRHYFWDPDNLPN